ncbi:MAG: phage holin family protein [Bacteroidaceae bacterium]|nr:phage holin family protein [Bacteroidaceae bacterium]
MDSVRFLFATALANVAGLLMPIKNDIYGLVLLFTLNFVIGMLADVCNHREWSFKKAFRFFRDAAIYFGMILSIYLLGCFKGEERAAVHCVSFMIYLAIYFYGTNILRNARLITDDRSTMFRILDFIYYLLSLRVLEQNKLLKDFVEHENDKKNMV